MIEWPLILLGGFLGSSHCVGMCGSFVVSLGASSSGWTDQLKRQLTYSFGRIFTYVFLGFMIGAGGARLTQWSGSAVRWQAWLAMGAGLVLVWQGLVATRLMPRLGFGKRSQVGICTASSMYRSLLTTPGLAAPWIAGLLNGLLPCGLVYGYLALAGASGGPWHGGAIMLAFGLGTIPLMMAVGLGFSFASLAWRRRLLQVAAYCVLLTGMIAIARGVWSLGTTNSHSCPLCG